MRRMVSTAFLLIAGLAALLAGALPAAAVAATTTVVNSAPNPSSAGQTVTLTATVSSGGTVLVNAGTVAFFDNGTQISPAEPLPGGTATFSTSALAVGTHAISATFTPNNADVYATSTGSHTQTVTAATATPTPTVTPTVTPTMTPTGTMTPRPTATATVTQPGAVVVQPGAPAPVPVGAVGTGGGGSLDSGASVALLAAGSSLVLGGLGTGAYVIRRRRGSRRT